MGSGIGLAVARIQGVFPAIEPVIAGGFNAENSMGVKFGA